MAREGDDGRTPVTRLPLRHSHLYSYRADYCLKNHRCKLFSSLLNHVMFFKMFSTSIYSSYPILFVRDTSPDAILSALQSHAVTPCNKLIETSEAGILPQAGKNPRFFFEQCFAVRV